MQAQQFFKNIEANYNRTKLSFVNKMNMQLNTANELLIYVIYCVRIIKTKDKDEEFAPILVWWL